MIFKLHCYGFYYKFVNCGSIMAHFLDCYGVPSTIFFQYNCRLDFKQFFQSSNASFNVSPFVFCIFGDLRQKYCRCKKIRKLVWLRVKKCRMKSNNPIPTSQGAVRGSHAPRYGLFFRRRSALRPHFRIRQRSALRRYIKIQRAPHDFDISAPRSDPIFHWRSAFRPPPPNRPS